VQRHKGFSDTPLVYGPPLPDTLTGQNVAHPGQAEKRPPRSERKQHVCHTRTYTFRTKSLIATDL